MGKQHSKPLEPDGSLKDGNRYWGSLQILVLGEWFL